MVFKFHSRIWVKKLVKKELHSEINKEYSERIVRFCLLNISYTFSLFTFIYFLGFKDSYNSIFGLYFWQNFTSFRWDLIHISMVIFNL